MGIVVPSGLYTDQGCQPLRERFFFESRVDFLYGFENRWPTVFSAVDGRFKFITFGTQKSGKTDRFKCAFMEHDPERLPMIDAKALLLSLEKVQRFSGDSLSLPEFNDTKSLRIGLKILGDNPLIGNGNGIRVEDEVHKTNDSGLFCEIGKKVWPVYQGGQIWFFDHTFSDVDLWIQDIDAETYARKEIISASRNRHQLLFKPNNDFVPDRTWSDEPRLVFREVAASTNERTFIFAIIPPNSLHTYSLRSFERFYLTGNNPKSTEMIEVLSFDELAIYLAVLNSFVVDFYMRAQCTNHLSTIYMYAPIVQSAFEVQIKKALFCRAIRLTCSSKDLAVFWEKVFYDEFKNPNFWYPPLASIDNYGPAHEQEIRKRLRDEAKNLTPEWVPHCGVHDRLPDRRDTGDRAQLRAEIDAYVAHLYGLSRDDFAYILDTFPVLKKKEEKAFGEFMSKRKCLEEYDRIGKIMNAER
jgi:hypothetical protein